MNTRSPGILWDMQIHTGREIATTKPDIVIQDHENKTFKLNDMAVLSDRHLNKDH